MGKQLNPFGPLSESFKNDCIREYICVFIFSGGLLPEFYNNEHVLELPPHNWQLKVSFVFILLRIIKQPRPCNGETERKKAYEQRHRGDHNQGELERS